MEQPSPPQDAAPGARAGSPEGRLRSLLDAALTFAGETTLEEVLDELVGTAASVTGARFAVLGLIDDPDEPPRRFVGPGGLPAAGPAAQDDRATALLVSPVAVGDEPFGVLYLGDREDGGPFTEGERTAVATLVRLAADTLVNRRLMESARSWAAQLESLREVSDTIVAGVGTTELLDLIVRQLRRLVGAGGAVLGMFDEDGGCRVVAGDGTGSEMLAIDPALPPAMLAALQDGRTVRLDASPEHGGEPAGHPACLLAPLMSGGRLQGVLSAAEKEGGTRFTGDDERVIEVFAHRAAIALELSQRFTRASVHSLVQWQDAERRRLGRELHDGTGQELTAALLALRRIDRLLGDNARGHEEVAALRELLAESLRGVRRLSALLTPPSFEVGDLVDALEGLALTLEERTGLSIHVESDGARVPDHLAETLYRVAQEALTNVVRHAGATCATVRVERVSDGTVRLSVVDDGAGVDPGSAFGIGLSGMRERTRLAGGRLSLAPGPDGGSVLLVEVPSS